MFCRLILAIALISSSETRGPRVSSYRVTKSVFSEFANVQESKVSYTA